MRRAVVLLLAVNAAMLGVRAWQEVGQAEAGASGGVGDMNGDGFIDISDPVFLLEHIFLGGPAPVSAASPELESRVTELEDLLVGVSRVDIDDGQGGAVDTVRFEGVNVQVVNGNGQTGQTPNGAGNLIVGYNIPVVDGESDRTGSHNIVCGDQNNYASWGSLITGTHNTGLARFANVLGGRELVADEDWGVVGLPQAPDVEPPQQVAFWGSSIRIGFEESSCSSPNCRGQQRGDATFRLEDQGRLEGAELSSDSLTFETDRATDLAFDLWTTGVTVVWERSSGGIEFRLDGEHVATAPTNVEQSPGSQIFRFLIPDVPAGEHTLTAEGRAVCCNSYAAAILQLESVVVFYLK